MSATNPFPIPEEPPALAQMTELDGNHVIIRSPSGDHSVRIRIEPTHRFCSQLNAVLTAFLVERPNV